MLLICLESDKMSPLSNVTTKTVSFIFSQYQIHLCKVKNDNKITNTVNFMLKSICTLNFVVKSHHSKVACKYLLH